MSGIELEEIKIYKVGIELDQDYEERTIKGEDHKEHENFTDIGLVKPMAMKGEIDPYTKKKVKPIPKKINSTCC